MGFCPMMTSVGACMCPQRTLCPRALGLHSGKPLNHCNWELVSVSKGLQVKTQDEDRVLYRRSIQLRVPVKVVGPLHDGHVELANDQGGALSHESAHMEVGAPAGTSEGPEAVEHSNAPQVPWLPRPGGNGKQGVGDKVCPPFLGRVAPTVRTPNWSRPMAFYPSWRCYHTTRCATYVCMCLTSLPSMAAIIGLH